MKIQIIQVPYDSGHRNVRLGMGPKRFIDNKIDQELKKYNHEVKVTRIESDDAFPTEITTSFKLNRLLADQVKSAIDQELFPLVLSGNCNCCLGTIAGISLNRLGVIWFDAHGEFNTPDTTLSGFLDGMPLAMATGRCWKAIIKTIPGFIPVRDENIVLIGARDLDSAEEELLKQSKVTVVKSEGLNNEEIREATSYALNELQARVEGVYLHLDMDSLDLGSVSANDLDSPGGLQPDLVEDIVSMVKKMFKVHACGIAAYDPNCDREGKALQTGIKLIKNIVSETN